MNLLINQVSPGVDEISYAKVNFLTSIINKKIHSKIISKISAIGLLGTMQGGYNVPPLIQLLNKKELAPFAFKALKNILLIFDNFHKITKQTNNNNIICYKNFRILG